jgi:integrase
MAKLFKRDGSTSYYARIRTPSGAWRVVSTRCTDKRAAETVAARLEREAHGLADAASNATTTAECATAFVESRIARGRSAGTLHFYGVKLGHAVRLLPEFIAQVRFKQLEAYRSQRLAEGAHRTTTEKELGAIRAMLWHAAKSGMYPHDPAREVPDIGDSYQPRERSLTLAEVQALLEALPPARAAWVAFVVATGARRGEAERAQRGDVRGDYVLLRGTKTALAPRTVPIVPPFHLLLAYSLERANGSGRLLATWSNAVRDLGLACTAAGIRPATPNDLRRTPATLLRAAGVATDIIAAFLGHSTSRMVERVYGRLSPQQIRERMLQGMGERYVSDANLRDVRETNAKGPAPMPLNPSKFGTLPVPRDGIEPPTRGFSIPVIVRRFPGKVGGSPHE